MRGLCRNYCLSTQLHPSSTESTQLTTAQLMGESSVFTSRQSQGSPSQAVCTAIRLAGVSEWKLFLQQTAHMMVCFVFFLSHQPWFLLLHFSDAFLALWAPQGEFHRDSLCSREAAISRTGRLAPKQCAWVNSTRGWILLRTVPLTLKMVLFTQYQSYGF